MSLRRCAPKFPARLRFRLVLPLGAAYKIEPPGRQKKGDARWASAAEFREETSKKGQQRGGDAVLLRCVN